MKKIILIVITMILTLNIIFPEAFFWKNDIVVQANGITIGSKNKNSEWWKDFSDIYQLHGNFDITFTFNNYSNGETEYNNYIMVFSKQLQGLINVEERTNDYAEYAIIRADAYGWGYSQSNDMSVNKTYLGNPISYDTDIYNDRTGETFIEIMKDASVTVRVKRSGTFIQCQATMVSNKDKTKSGYVTTSFSEIAEDIWFTFTVEKCYLDNFSYQDNTGDSIVAINDSIPTKQQGIPLDKNALAVVGKSDLSSEWWEDHTKSYLLSGDTKLTFTFNHYSSENNVDGSDNFVYHFTNKAYVVDDNNRADDYIEHAILYANDTGYSLTGGAANNNYNRKDGVSYEGYPIEYTRSYHDINELKMILSAATVTTTIRRTGKMITVNEKAISKLDVSKYYTREVVIYTTSDDIYVGFTTNGCYFEILSAPNDALARESKVFKIDDDVNKEVTINRQEEKQEISNDNDVNSNNYEDDESQDIESINIKRILKLKKTKATIKKGRKIQIKVIVKPTTKIEYSSSNKMIATVNSIGTVKARGKGKAVISVKANGITKKFKVTVK